MREDRHLFTENINNWDDWYKIYQSIAVFTPLVKHIQQKENLPLVTIENVKPGTNAVFKVDRFIIKIFAPPELHDTAHNGYGKDFNVELFGIKWANDMGVPSPNLIAHGIIEDKYTFLYMVMDYVHGTELDKIEHRLSYQDKVTIGQNVRNITNKLNLPCNNFTPIDVMEYAISNDDWKSEGFAESFLVELTEYLKDFRIGEKVYCHGDFHSGNVLVDEKMNVSIVDFADSMYAPAEYELVYIVSSLFRFEKPYMEGYFGKNYVINDILELCMAWLPIHAWTHGLLADTIGPATEITSFAIMRERLRTWIEGESPKT